MNALDRVILIGDSDKIYSSVMKVVFKKGMNLVYVTKDPLDAIDKCKEYYPDIIIYEHSTNCSNLTLFIKQLKECNSKIRMVLL